MPDIQNLAKERIAAKCASAMQSGPAAQWFTTLLRFQTDNDRHVAVAHDNFDVVRTRLPTESWRASLQNRHNNRTISTGITSTIGILIGPDHEHWLQVLPALALRDPRLDCLGGAGRRRMQRRRRRRRPPRRPPGGPTTPRRWHSTTRSPAHFGKKWCTTTSWGPSWTLPAATALWL